MAGQRIRVALMEMASGAATHVEASVREGGVGSIPVRRERWRSGPDCRLEAVSSGGAFRQMTYVEWWSFSVCLANPP
jgi:hypothetical protein